MRVHAFVSMCACKCVSAERKEGRDRHGIKDWEKEGRREEERRKKEPAHKEKE